MLKKMDTSGVNLSCNVKQHWLVIILQTIDTKNADNNFTLYYDMKKDSRFNNNSFYDFCIKNNKTFYVRFGNDEDAPTQIVRYNRK